jgi:hypothetical protein
LFWGLNRVDKVGTTLERLWSFVEEFQAKKAGQEEVGGLDSKIKGRLWKHLLQYGEVILKAGDELLLSVDNGEVCTPESKLSGIEHF